MSYDLKDLNQMDQDAFTETIGSVFEHSPWIAEQAWYLRPFTSVSELHAKMVDVVNKSDRGKKLELLRAHPDLGRKVEMTSESIQEQKGAGLNQLSQLEREDFLQLNQAYTEKFEFPFIMAVKGKDKENIKFELKRRVDNDQETELEAALQEIYKIARFRLDEKIKS